MPTDSRRVAIVTGGSSGIGAATAKMLAAEGVDVLVNYAGNTAGAEATVAACKAAGADAIAVQGDVSDDTVCRTIVAAAIDRWGRLDYLVNNAGTTKAAAQNDLDALDADDFLRIYGVNTVGVYQMVRAAVPYLKDSGNGAIVNTSSIAGLTGIGSSMAYAASKGALNTMTLSLARNLAPEIRVNAVCPGFVDSEWWAKQHDEAKIEKMRAHARSTVPLARVVTSEDVAEVILMFTVRGQAITGQLLAIDAGMTINLGQRLANPSAT